MSKGGQVAERLPLGHISRQKLHGLQGGPTTRGSDLVFCIGKPANMFLGQLHIVYGFCHAGGSLRR
jgi:hypothetical protein